MFQEREREKENAVRERRKKKNETKKTTLKKSDEREHAHRVESARRFRRFPHVSFDSNLSSAFNVLSAWCDDITVF